MNERLVSRRQFLRGLGITAGMSCLGGIVAACDSLFSPTIDSAYLELDRQHRAVSLIGGRIPESWKTLTPDALMPPLEAEIAGVVLPEVCAILGGDAQDIVRHLEYDSEEDKILALVQQYGESNSTLATDVAKQGIGVTVSRFSDTNPVPDKRIAINLTKILELGQADLAKAQPVDKSEASARLNTFIVQSVVDAVIHEATHYTMELDRLPQPGDLERAQAMYSGGAIGTVEFQRLLYYEGVQIAFISLGGYKYYLNKALIEIFRAHVMQRLLDELEAGITNSPERFVDSVYYVDRATNDIMDFIHSGIGIEKPAPPLAVFKNDLLRIIDYYQNPSGVSSQSHPNWIHLTDRDFVRIFGLFESFYASVNIAVEEAGGQDLMTAELRDRAKLEIDKVIVEARDRK